jgi:cytochrome c-type biogenesis protein CcmH/NrfG
VLADSGQDEAAAEQLGAATQLKPDDATAWWSLGLAERRRKRLPEAIRALERAYQISPTAPRITDLGVAVRDQGDLKRAEALFHEALRKSALYQPARLHLLQILSVSGRCVELGPELHRLSASEQVAGEKLRQACRQRK